jgi:hypothetical protein
VFRSLDVEMVSFIEVDLTCSWSHIDHVLARSIPYSIARPEVARFPSSHSLDLLSLSDYQIVGLEEPPRTTKNDGQGGDRFSKLKRPESAVRGGAIRDYGRFIPPAPRGWQGEWQSMRDLLTLRLYATGPLQRAPRAAV